MIMYQNTLRFQIICVFKVSYRPMRPGVFLTMCCFVFLYIHVTQVTIIKKYLLTYLLTIMILILLKTSIFG